MANASRASISAALIVVVCFLLPWVQVSCGASKDTLTGVDLAREGHHELWLIPLLMLAVVCLGVVRRRNGGRDLSGLVSFVAGLTSAYLMNRERLRAEDSSGLLTVRLTGWFWLGLASSIVIAGIAVFHFLRRPKPP
jgi:ABC-type Fe3+ transport system permease subunit